jgi:hypothetical protein
VVGRGIFKEKGQSESSGHRIGVSTSLASDMFFLQRSDSFHAKEEVERP